MFLPILVGRAGWYFPRDSGFLNLPMFQPWLKVTDSVISSASNVVYAGFPRRAVVALFASARLSRLHKFQVALPLNRRHLSECGGFRILVFRWAPSQDFRIKALGHQSSRDARITSLRLDAGDARLGELRYVK